MKRTALKRRTRLRQTPKGPARAVLALVKSTTDVCQFAASPDCTGRADHLHHRKLRKQGGDNSPANLWWCCLACHSFVHLNPALSYSKGWLVHPWDDPSEVLVSA